MALNKNIGFACGHGTIKKIALPCECKGALFGGIGYELTDDEIKDNRISLFISLSSTAFEGGEMWFGKHYAWPMVDYSCWPLEVFAERCHALHRAIDMGERVLVACSGGHGRTGTLIGGVLAVMGEKLPVEALRASYCHKAIEVEGQEKSVKYMSGNSSLESELLDLYGTRDKPRVGRNTSPFESLAGHYFSSHRRTCATCDNVLFPSEQLVCELCKSYDTWTTGAKEKAVVAWYNEEHNIIERENPHTDIVAYAEYEDGEWFEAEFDAATQRWQRLGY